MKPELVFATLSALTTLLFPPIVAPYVRETLEPLNTWLLATSYDSVISIISPSSGSGSPVSSVPSADPSAQPVAASASSVADRSRSPG